MPLNKAPESAPSGDRIKLLEQSMMNLRSTEWVVYVLSKLYAEQKHVSPVVTVGLHS
jgi:hypothetical protein